MDLAIEFNNIGVSFLNIGKPNEACDMFKGAFELLNFVSQNESSQSCSNGRASPLHINDQRHIRNAESLMSRSASDTEKVIILPSQQEHESINPRSPSFSRRAQNPFVYQHSLKMEKHGFNRHDSSSPPNKVKIAVAVVAYNLALVYHIKWLDSPGNRSVLQGEVLKAYEISSRLLCEDSSSPPCLLLKTILMNNMGQIHHELGNYDLSRAYLDRLINSIRTQGGAQVSSWQDLSRHLVVETDESWEEMKQDFLLNATFLTAPQVAPAS